MHFVVYFKLYLRNYIDSSTRKKVIGLNQQLYKAVHTAAVAKRLCQHNRPCSSFS